MSSLIMLFALCALIHSSSAAISSFSYVPLGNNPTLYQPGLEPIMHLDQHTFYDTVFRQNHAFVVEFYADWCGHCRAFAPYYRDFAYYVKEWNPIVTVAAINCADSFNAQVCSENGITYYPILKYFPRTARSPNQAQNLETKHSAEEIREAVMRMVANEYSVAKYPDWPNFSHIVVDAHSTYGHLWEGIPESANYLAIIFEVYDGIGARFILDLVSRSNVLGARRALSNSPLVQMLRILQFPTVALFKRDHQQALYMQMYSNSTYSDLDRVILNDAHDSRALQTLRTTTIPPLMTTTQISIVDCNMYPDSCRQLYFVSETDMLKAMRMALYDEVIRTPGHVKGENFTALEDFITFLSHHFPVLSFSNDARSRRTTSTVLRNSERARMVFAHLREYLGQRRGENSVSVDDYRRQFENVERVFASPFPVSSSWQHCKGTTPVFRGYTCGLWTTFHALTVHTYIDTIKENSIDALKPLKAIQGWVRSFFGCQDCKNHFMNMTTKMFPMTERRVRYPHDMMTYLWRAHNIVNNRLHGDPSEDPQFLKMQFPPPFLCPICHSGGQFSKRQVRHFLLRYYGSIRPHNHQTNRHLAVH